MTYDARVSRHLHATDVVVVRLDLEPDEAAREGILKSIRGLVPDHKIAILTPGMDLEVDQTATNREDLVRVAKGLAHELDEMDRPFAASIVRNLVRALQAEHHRANALERIGNDPESIPNRIAGLTQAVEALREAIPRGDEKVERADPRCCECGHFEAHHYLFGNRPCDDTRCPCRAFTVDPTPLGPLVLAAARAGVVSPAATTMCRCGHSSQFHHHRGIGHCGECSACEVFFEAYPEAANNLDDYIVR